MLTHLDLFTGIGGFSLALRDAVQTKMYCEICPLARVVLQRQMTEGHLRKAPIADDIRLLNPPKCDVITAGWPCTGFSLAGNGEGFAQADSALFSHVLRIVRSTLPVVVILENTPAAAGVAQNRIARPLIRLGYTFTSGLFRADSVGIPQKRLRWFAIAYRCKSTLSTLQRHITTPRIGAEPVRTKQYSNKLSERFKLLRNCVVPRCAAFAIQSLATGDPIKSADLDLGLTMRQGNVQVHKQLWPTLAGHWQRGADVLTSRACRHIGTAVKFEKGTQNRDWPVNVHWLEYLMGFPSGWTAL